MQDLGGKTVHAMAEADDSDTDADLLTFSVEFSPPFLRALERLELSSTKQKAILMPPLLYPLL